ncbi:MAG: hypothetical protein HQK54_02900 [Oligoflexales bacterium]|nr:hypothetical protein [Oligoflexales bacterium]
MKKKLNQGLITLVSIAVLTGCGDKGSTKKHENTPTPSSLAQVSDAKDGSATVALSKNVKYKFTDKFSASIDLQTAQAEDQRPFYDEAAKEGLLTFSLTTQWIDDSGNLKGAGYRTTYCSRSSYLFTQVNQRNLSLDKGFDNDEAKIFLKHGGNVVEVGRYIKPATHLDYSDRFNLWIHPILCEGDYAKVCRLEVNVTGEGIRLGKDLQATIKLYLKSLDGRENLTADAVTPTTSRLPSFEYFGCDSLVEY